MCDFLKSSIKRVSMGIIVILIIIGTTSCGASDDRPATTDISQPTDAQPVDDAKPVDEDSEADVKSDSEEDEDMTEDKRIILNIDGSEAPVAWEESETVNALKEILAEGDIEIQMSMYGGFEQVGSLGFDLPSNDIEQTTSSGDIVLYSGDQIVLFYGSNSWSYTKLGKIQESDDRISELLSNGDVTITLSI